MNAPAEQKAAQTEQAKRALYLSHFTPSMMPPETLEAMFVQREPLLRRVMGNITESLRTGSRHHTLLVGPRGIGKTHLISLLHHRLSQTQEAKDKALIAWMREEEWGVTSFFELVLRILRTLDATYPKFNIAKRTEPLYELKVDEAAQQAEALLLDVLAEKCLVILMENLDDLFDQIGNQGQKAWRAFIQNQSNIVLVCTTPSLFAGVTIHQSPFYGFFDIEPLKEFEFEEVVTLLRKIAVERNDADLASFIETPEGRARIRAAHHLAEGNPRIYIIFAQFLSHEALDELVQAFMHTLDELTPYYQARMKELPAQQRKIIEYLVSFRGAAPVNRIARSCFITQQICSSQLGQLKDKRFVRATKEGRGSYYELSEPMMRLCMEVKQQRGEPISLFVEMIRIWYRLDELQNLVSKNIGYQSLHSEYVSSAIGRLEKHGDPKIDAVLKDLSSSIQLQDINGTLDLHKELKAIGVIQPESWVYATLALARLSPVGTNISSTEVQQLTGGLLDLIRNQDLFFDDPVNRLIAYTKICYGTFKINAKRGRELLPKFWDEIAKKPSAGEFAMMLLIKQLGQEKEFPIWLNEVLAHRVQKGIRDRYFVRYEALLAAIQSGDPIQLLALPREYRNLLGSYSFT